MIGSQYSFAKSLAPWDLVLVLQDRRWPQHSERTARARRLVIRDQGATGRTEVALMAGTLDRIEFSYMPSPLCSINLATNAVHPDQDHSR